MTAVETVAAIRAALEEAGREYRARVDDILDAVLAELSPPRAEVSLEHLEAATQALDGAIQQAIAEAFDRKFPPKRIDLLTEPHDGHEATVMCPGCPHVPRSDR